MQNNSYNNFYDYSGTTLTNQSILDVFVLQDVIDGEDAEKLRTKFKTNREIESFLIKNRIVSRDTINKAYSILFKLPYVELKNVEIPVSLKNIFPESIAKKFGIIPFGTDEGLIRLALSRPADLLLGFQSGLQKLFSDKEMELELFVTGETDFLECLKQYRDKNNGLLLKRGALPVVYLRGQAIPEAFLNKFPHDFVEKYHIVVFGQNRRGSYLVACEEPDSPITIKILDFIKKENGIKMELFATSTDDIKYILSLINKTSGDTAAPEINIQTRSVQTGGTGLGESAKQGLEKEIAAEKLNKPVARDAKATIVNNKEADEGPELTIDQKKSAETEAKRKGEAESQANVLNSEAVVVADDTLGVDPNHPENSETVEDTTAVDTSAVEYESDLGSLLTEEVTDAKSLATIVREGSVPKIVAAIVNFALNSRASDVHVEPEIKFLRIRCRIDGILRDIIKIPLKFHLPFVSRIKIMSKLKIDETRIPQDGRFDVNFKDRSVDVRVSTMPTVHGEKVELRVLDKSQTILSLEDLGVQGSAFTQTIAAIEKPYGLILTTGPTGSGKSTTLYAILNRISVPGVNVITLEDPVEYEIPGINQCQVKPDIGFTFATGLRSVLRQDPNVIMVGEIRDAETASMAVHSALTGHLVLSTLHTNDAAGALPRLINMGVEPFLITSSINLVLAQRLVRRICPKCREEMKVPAKLMEQLKAELSKISANNVEDRRLIPAEMKLYYGKGCNECDHGFKGRVGLYEVMPMTPQIEELAIEKKSANEISASAIANGMITMRQDGIIKAFMGLTTIDEVFQAAINN